MRVVTNVTGSFAGTKPPANEHASPAAPQVLAVGQWGLNEFAQLRQELDPHAAWPTVADLSHALADADRKSPTPDVVLFAEARPGVLTQDHIDRCRRRWPLTCVIVVAGTWCEGELRTGQPPSGVVRLYWYEFAAWWRAALARAAAGLTPQWSEPLFDVRAGCAIQVIDRSAAVAVRPSRSQSVVIDSTDYATYEALKLGLGDFGWEAIWQPRHRPHIGREGAKPALHAAGVWDGGQLDAAEREHLRAFCGRMRACGAPVVVLLDFPRGEHPQAACELGAATVVAKPYQLALLDQELLRLQLTTRP